MPYDEPMTTTVRVGLSVVCALGLAACSGGSDDATPSTSVVPPTQPSTPPATSVDTPLATTTTSTTIAPATTIDPAVVLATEVEAGLREYDRLLNEALMDPFDEAKVAAALDASIGFAQEQTTSAIEQYRTDGQAIRPSQVVEASITIEQPATFREGTTEVAQLVSCEIDPWVVVEVGAGPGGTDAIVNDEIYAYRSIVFLRLIEGRWKVEGSEQLSQTVGVTSCPAA